MNRGGTPIRHVITASDGGNVRQADLSDAPACAVILQDWLDATPGMPKLHDMAQTTEWLRSDLFPRAEVAVVEADNAVRGFLALAQDDIAALYLAEGWRGSGLGAQLLTHAKMLRGDGLSLWTFQANLAARRFYARHGFVETAMTDGDNDEGLPDVQLGWYGDQA